MFQIKRRLTYIGLALMLPCLLTQAQTTPPSTLTQRADTAPTAKSLTLNFQDIDTRKLLQIIAQYSNENFVINNDVKGSMSIHLKNVTWQEALDVILKSQALGKQTIGNSLLIGPMDALAAKQIQALELQKKIALLEPQETKLIRLNYANAKDVVTMLQREGVSLLSERGEVSYDERTNSVWVKDNAKHIKEIQRLIKRLDQPVKQVEIQARLVTIDEPYQRELGAKFGLSQGQHLSGTLAGANQLASGTTPSAVTPVTDRLNFNLPVSASSLGTPGTIGLAVARLGNFFVDVELSALEKEGHGEVIGSPRLITSNQHTAKILTGQEIPYSVASSSGASTIEYKNADLSLEVKPQVTPDNRIILDLSVKRNEISTTNVSVQGQTVTPINTEEEKSQVLLNNGETVVLGGVLTHTKSKTVLKVPFLGDIPILGHLFKNTVIKNNKNELLIFLTPKIISNPSQLQQG